MLRKFAYFSKAANQTSASSDGSPRNTGGANVVSIITGIADVATAGGGVADDDDDDVVVMVMTDGAEATVDDVVVVTPVVVVGVGRGLVGSGDRN